MDVDESAEDLLAPLRLKGVYSFTYRLVWLLSAPIVYLFWRANIKGKENVKGLKGFILAPVHRSYVDPAIVGLAFWRPLRPLAKEESFRTKLGWIWKYMGSCPLRRGEADRRAMRTAIAWINAGEHVIIFPEGTRREGDSIADIHDGVAYLAVKTGCPVVPVGLGGTVKAMPRGSKFIHRSKVTVEFGEPLYANPDLKARQATADLSERLKAGMQETFDEARRRA